MTGRPRILPYGSAEERARARDEVARHVAGGGLVAYPTETVYGLGCTLAADALDRLARLKGDRPFLLLIRARGDTPGLEWTEAADRLAERFWPGPLTLALTDTGGRFPARVVGPDGAVAVRMSPHPCVMALLEAAAGPVTSTSANRPGEPPARTALAAAEAAAGEAALLVLDGGELPPGPPSTIVRCGERVRVVREGAVPRAELAEVVELE